MAKFSERLGITKAPQEIQIQSMNDDLRNSLWNWVFLVLRYDAGRESLPKLWKDYFKQPLDLIPYQSTSNVSGLREHFMQGDWYEPYNIVQFVYTNVLMPTNRPTFERDLKRVLQGELSGYRMINSELVPISDSNEIESIRQAMSEPASVGLEGASEHIRKALSLLGRKPEPDYANSIKESISAVESVCKTLTGEKAGGIDKALAKLAAKTSLHPALKEAFSKLYAYTSDESGIRHAIFASEDKDIDFADAKFMLVVCSAFVNFALEKARQAKLI